MPMATPTQVTKPYDYSQVGMVPTPISSYSRPYQSDPYSEITFSPWQEFGQPYSPKAWAKAMTNPEADPRFGPVKQKGFQIDPRPFKMKQKAEKRKAKLAKKQKYGKGSTLKFNEVD